MQACRESSITAEQPLTAGQAHMQASAAEGPAAPTGHLQGEGASADGEHAISGASHYHNHLQHGL